jgi:hypothetical protein
MTMNPTSTKSTIDCSPSLVIDAFVFPKSNDWEWTENSISGVPGTWHERIEGMPKWTLALICCPNNHVSILGSQVSKVSSIGKVYPSYQCRPPTGHGTCSFHRNAYLDRWNKKPLYACAIERDGKPEMIYTHASTQAEARIQLGPGNYRIVAIGPAIGYFVADKKGDVLTTD